MTDTDTTALLVAIDAGDRFALVALADWLEEIGDSRAAGVRWLAVNQKWPDSHDEGFVCWYFAMGVREQILPELIVDAADRKYSKDGGFFRGASDAILAAASALVEFGEA